MDGSSISGLLGQPLAGLLHLQECLLCLHGFEYGDLRKAALLFSCATSRSPQAGGFVVFFFVRNKHVLLGVRLVV